MRHHDIALEGFVQRVSTDDTVLAVIVSGSLARGEETAASDIDLYLVVTEPVWDRAMATSTSSSPRSPT
jgi:predicted nucleotidyltransferase